MSFETGPKNEQASERDAAERLGARLSDWRRKYLPLILVSAGAGASVEHLDFALEHRSAPEAASNDPERETYLGVEVSYGELHGLSPDLTPRRMRHLLETMPRGFLDGEIGSIRFSDKTLEMPSEYGEALHAQSESAAYAAGGAKEAKVEIVFWKGAKTLGPDQLWGGILAHEIAHGNDWRTDRLLTDAERAEMEKAVSARVSSDDRFRSAYVESITNADAGIQLRDRAVEYWAEITGAYLEGKPLVEADAALVRRAIARKDPSFDRDQALAKRKKTLDNMMLDSLDANIGDLPDGLGDAMRWIYDRVDAEKDDLAHQAEGRAELVGLFRSGLTDAETAFALKYVEFRKRQEQLLQYQRVEKKRGDRFMVGAIVKDMRDLFERGEDIHADVEADASGRFRDLLARERAVFERHGLVPGGFRGVELAAGEEARLFPDDARTDKIHHVLGWYEPKDIPAD